MKIKKLRDTLILWAILSIAQTAPAQIRVPTNNYYEALGISDDASNSEIKRAYRKLALKWHPDKFQFNTNPDITEIDFHETFQAVSRAYSTLSDEIKREKYDRNGKNDLNVDDTSDDETCCTWLLHIFEILKEKCSDSKRRS